MTQSAMSILVKICGLKTRETMAAALEAGADYVGLVFFGPSPRNVTVTDAIELAEMARGRAKIVALTVDADDDLIRAISGELSPQIIQCHGSESVERLRQIRVMSRSDVMKAIKVATADETRAALDYAYPKGPCELVLFDAKAPKNSVLPGGNGLAFDWRILDNLPESLNYMLSGGLDADNVAEAVRLTGAGAVDVSSGVESSPGVKDIARIRDFLAAAKAL